MSKNNGSREPLYFRIKRDLVEKIQKGAWAVSDQLPPEPELEKSYDASRGTVRRALLELELEGYITRMSGRGTFVTSSRARLQTDLEEIMSFSQQATKAGFQPSSKILEKGIGKAAEAQGRVCEGFRITPDRDVIHIKRLRLSDGVPMAIQSVFLLPPRFPEILEEDLSQLMKLYREKYGVRLTSADEVLHASPAQEEEAKLLRLKPGAPVVIRDRISLDQNGEPFEVLHSVEAGDKFEYGYRIVEDFTHVVLDIRGIPSQTRALKRRSKGLPRPSIQGKKSR